MEETDFVAILESIEVWLQTNDPEYYEHLQAPFDQDVLRGISDQLETELPEDFFTLYGRHNGVASNFDCTDSKLFDGWHFMPVQGEDGLLGELNSFVDQDFQESAADGPVKRMVYNERWVPIANDFGGNFIGIDLDPPIDGDYGQVIRFGCEEIPTVLASSLAEYLRDFCQENQISIVDSRPSTARKQTVQSPGKSATKSKKVPESQKEATAQAVPPAANSNVINLFSRSSQNAQASPPPAKMSEKAQPATKSASDKSAKKFLETPVGKLEELAQTLLRDPSLIEEGLPFVNLALNSGDVLVQTVAALQVYRFARDYSQTLVSPTRHEFVLRELNICAEPLICLLSSDSEELVTEAISALSVLIGRPTLMTDKPSSTRTPALIEERFQPVFFKNLIQLLEVPALRAEAAHAIGMLGTYGKSAAPALFKVLREKRDVSVILTALYYIDAPIDGEDAEIAQHLKNSDPRTASAACSLLAQRGDLAAKHRDLILPLLNDARGHCKQEANRALMAILIVSKKET